MVGRAIALDLAAAHRVTAIDRSAEALATLTALQQQGHPVTTKAVDLGAGLDRLDALVAPFDLVVCAVPGFMGYATLEAVIEAGKDVVDISFFPEDALTLDEKARARGVTAIVDMGVAPGMGNVILGYHDTRMTVDTFECLVGGLPVARTWPFAYKAPFSPVDVIEEYTRPARYVEGGRLVVRAALSEPEMVEFAGVGTLEAFNTDGLRSLIQTMPHIPNMKEKTLRYPGHITWIQGLKAAGFFDATPVQVEGQAVSPLAFTSRILFDAWRLGPDEPERTVMRITVAGEKDGRPHRVVYHLHDTYDPETGFSSMARTTGFTCTAAVNLMVEDRFTNTGVFPPERVGQADGCFDFIRAYLADRGVVYQKAVQAT